MADVQPEPLRWLWPERIPSGKVTMIAGDPGLGKSLLTIDMAARVSTGAGWPDCPHERGEVGGVVLLTAEDDLADTIRPRLDAAGADVDRIIALQAVRQGDGPARVFNLATDLPALDQAIRKCDDCRLVIVDPITAYLGRTDSHKNAEGDKVWTMPKKPKALSDQLREAIRKAEKRGITRYRIAQLSGVHTGQISRLMDGRVSPRLDTAQRIADAIDCEIIIRHK